MFLPEGARMAGVNLWSHKMRSLLTILGVVIGVGSVLAVVTLGKSFEEGVVSGFDAVDDKTIFVSVNQAGSSIGEGPPDAQGYGRIFSERDVEVIAQMPGVETVIVQATQPIFGFNLAGRFIPFQQGLSTSDPESDLVRDLAGGYEQGTVFGADAPEIVLSHDVAERFGDGDKLLPVGTQMDILFLDGSSETVTVVGVLAEESNPFVQFTANSVFAPIERYYTAPTQQSPVTGDDVRVYDGLAVIAEDPRALDDVAAAVRSYLGSVDSDAQFFLVEDTVILVASASDITKAIGTAFDQITVFIGAIGGISLLVGAIGIANIMLVSVTERTREIGVMKAIGARDREILLLFLLESTIIGLIGAVLGVALGLSGGYAVVEGVFGSEGFGVVIPYDWLAISLLIGVGVGIVAGLIPAWRATRVQPVQALAYE